MILLNVRDKAVRVIEANAPVINLQTLSQD